MAYCIETSQLCKRYGATQAVKDLNLTVEPGKVLGLLGPNGAGKSTTLYMLAGLVPPTSGTVTLFGKDLRKHFLKVMPRVGVLMERPTFYDHLSLRNNLLLLSKLSNRNVTIDRFLDMVGLLSVGSQKVRTLSHGMRQRLGLAQALLTEPELLLLDEPASGLDVEATQDILRLLRGLADRANVTIVVSSHIMPEVEVLCDQVAIMKDGALLACESTNALLSYDQSHVEILLDAPEAAAKRLQEQDWVVSVDTKSGKLRVQLREGTSHQLTSFLVNAGYKVSGVMPRRRSLEDYFLRVMNR